MTPDNRSFGAVLAISASGLGFRIAANALPNARVDLAVAVGMAIFALCLLTLGYGLAALIAWMMRL